MVSQREILLYTRPDCHLCELAAQMLEQHCATRGVAWYEVDIESDLNLIRKYGNHIPVLYRGDIDRALFWPFSPELVDAFLQHEI